MARVAARHPALRGSACARPPSSGEPVEAIEARDRRVPEFRALIDAYLDKFGDRCVDELKLESETLHDDPLPLLRAVGHLAAQPRGAVGRHAGEHACARRPANAPIARCRAIRCAASSSTGCCATRAPASAIARTCASSARACSAASAASSSSWAAASTRVDLLDEPRDIFYLEVDEVLAFVEGRATTTDLRGLVRIRRAEFAALCERDRRRRRQRIASRRAACRHQGHDFQRAARAGASASTDGGDDARAGPRAAAPASSAAACASSAIHARRRSISATILVAEHTDPGWIMLFPSAAGVLVERGSLLSHSAIVARELGIPAIVSVPGVTRWLRDGDWVEMDGATGRVRRIPADDAAVARRRARRTRLMRSEVATRAEFSQIRYAQVWEDADILLEGLDVQPGDVCVSIASAGDNALALLTRDPGARHRARSQPRAARLPRAARRRVPRADAPGAARADRLPAVDRAAANSTRAAVPRSQPTPARSGTHAPPKSPPASAAPASSSATSRSSARSCCRWSTRAPACESCSN